MLPGDAPPGRGRRRAVGAPGTRAPADAGWAGRRAAPTRTGCCRRAGYARPASGSGRDAGRESHPAAAVPAAPGACLRWGRRLAGGRRRGRRGVGAGRCGRRRRRRGAAAVAAGAAGAAGAGAGPVGGLGGRARRLAVAAGPWRSALSGARSSGLSATFAGALGAGGRLAAAERFAQPAGDRRLHRRRRGFDEFALFIQSGEDFLAGNTEFLSQLVYAGLTCHYISCLRGDSRGPRLGFSYDAWSSGLHGVLMFFATCSVAGRVESRTRRARPPRMCPVNRSMRNALVKARRRIACCTHCGSGCNHAPRPGRLPAVSTITAYSPFPVDTATTRSSSTANSRFRHPTHVRTGPLMCCGAREAEGSRWITAQSSVTSPVVRTTCGSRVSAV